MKSLFQVLTRKPEFPGFSANCWNNDADQIWTDRGTSFSPHLATALSGVLSQYLRSRRSNTITYMPVVDVDAIGVGNGAIFTIAADMSVRRSDGSIFSPTWYAVIGFQLLVLMVWDLGSPRLERPCRYLKAQQYFVSRGSDVVETLIRLIQLGNEKVGKMYPGFCTGPRVLVSKSITGCADCRLPGTLLWRLFQDLCTADVLGELPKRGEKCPLNI